MKHSSRLQASHKLGHSRLFPRQKGTISACTCMASRGGIPPVQCAVMVWYNSLPKTIQLLVSPEYD